MQAKDKEIAKLKMEKQALIAQQIGSSGIYPCFPHFPQSAAVPTVILELFYYAEAAGPAMPFGNLPV